MINLIINLLLIQLIVVFIIDLSGIIDSIKKFIWRKWIKIGDYHNISLKPISCSLCSVFWAGVIYLLVTGTFSLPMLAYVCFLSFMSSPIGDFLIWVKDLLTAFINLLYKPIGK